MRTLDLRGQKFGSKTVVAAAPSGKSGSRSYVRCDCGNYFAMYTARLKRNPTGNCPKCMTVGRSNRQAAALNDSVVGKKYGDRTVLAVRLSGRTGAIASVQCGCGFTSDVRLRDLEDGSALRCISCGSKESRRKQNVPSKESIPCSIEEHAESPALICGSPL